MQVDEKNVYKFLKTFVEDFFSKKLFGSKNIAVINSYIKKLICLKRFESFTLQDIINEIDLNDLEWYKWQFNPLFATEIIKNKKALYFSMMNFLFD